MGGLKDLSVTKNGNPPEETICNLHLVGLVRIPEVIARLVYVTFEAPPPSTGNRRERE